MKHLYANDTINKEYSMCCNCGCNWRPSFGYPRNHGKYWSRSERSYARRQYCRGRSISGIARDLGRTRTAIRDELGLNW